MPFRVGDVVDHYRLDEVVTHHASMTVYAAFDLRLLRKVALNVLPAELATSDATRARFTREAAAAAQLDHPSIVPVYDSNQHDGSFYYVTKYVDGVPLDDLQRSRPATVAESMVYLEQMASALDYIHRRGVVHGNVRPGNVLIATDELPHSALLFDVGITTQVEDSADPLSWVLPAGGDSTERRADVVGLARTAFELLTRHAPEDALASASMIDRQLPGAVDEVFADVLGGDRDMPCGQFVSALRRAMPADLLVYRPPLAAGSAAPEPATVATASSPPPRSPAVLGASIAAVIVLVVGAMWWQGSGSTRAAETIRDVAPTTPAFVPATTLATTTTIRPTTTTLATTTTIRPTTIRPTTTATIQSTTAAATTTIVAPTTPPPSALNPYGDPIGQDVTASASVAGQAAVALQGRQTPDAIADAGTPAAFYAQWLRVVAPLPIGPVVASADGYTIDALTSADLSAFHLGDNGRVTTFTECVGSACIPLDDGIEITRDCLPGADCNVFATDDGEVIAVLRATVLMRLPSITLLFKLSSETRDVAAVSDPYNTVRWDRETGYFSITLPSAPPPGTQTAVTISYLDGGRSTMTITWGS